MVAGGREGRRWGRGGEETERVGGRRRRGEGEGREGRRGGGDEMHGRLALTPIFLLPNHLRARFRVAIFGSSTHHELSVKATQVEFYLPSSSS